VSVEPNVRRLRPEDAASFVVLRREALESQPLAFGASVDDDRRLSVEFVRGFLTDGQEQAVFGAFEGGQLRGVAGIFRESRVKQRHKATIWGVYVTPQAREKGVGRALVRATIRCAREWAGVRQLHLTVADTAHSAKRLYEAAGFRAWGREPRALRWEGKFVDDFHLVLDLEAHGDDA
jgi:GNAT superfamily N-acetyltransferase